MSALGFRLAPSALRTLGVGALGLAALVAIAAAAMGYLAHHASPLGGHAVQTAALVVVVAAFVAVSLGAAVAARRPLSLPDVVVASPGSASLRAAQREDLDFCTALHASTLDLGFFVALGPRFLRSYNALFVDSPHAVALVATLGGHPVGALMGVLDTRAHRRWTVRQRGLRLVLGGVTALVTRPRPALRFVRTRAGRYVRSWLRHRHGDGDAEPDRGDDRGVAVVSHVAVLPGARGSGSGGGLVREFVKAAGRSGASRVTLVTLEGEGGASGFYAKLGWDAGTSHLSPEGDSLREWSLPMGDDRRTP